MKELSIEDKAKRYDEAIERARKINSGEGVAASSGWSVCEVIFPELKDSEDEKIRKAMIEGFEYYGNPEADWWIGIKVKDCIAYLEKQGEKGINGKNREIPFADKVEAKFKVGDYIKHNKANIICKVVSVNSGSYYVENIETGGRIELFNAEQNFHLWTIQDAKDGDVLACESGWTCIFKTLVNDETFSSYCFMDNTKWFCETGSECHTLKEEFTKAYNGEIHPATKEQLDTLTKVMADAGYTFDFEKKELKKIEQKLAENKGMNIVEEDMTPFQKKVFCIIDTAIEEEQGLKQVCDELLALASNEIEQKPAWSEEDEKMIQDIINDIAIAQEQVYCKSRCEDEINWLKFLKDRIVPQTKQEWGEEDERMYKAISIALSLKDAKGYLSSWHKTPDEAENWLKSLKDRYAWKPSDEQIEILDMVLTNESMDDNVARILRELREQLKKLREG